MPRAAKPMAIAATSSSRKVVARTKSLNKNEQDQFRLKAKQRKAAALEALTKEELRKLNALRDIPEPYEDFVEMDVEDVLRGNARMDISHEGGEFSAILEDRLVSEAKADKAAAKAKPKCKDSRICVDRTERRNHLFALQMEAMVEAYQVWSYNQGDEGLDTVGADYSGCPVDSVIENFRIIDTYRNYPLRTQETHCWDNNSSTGDVPGASSSSPRLNEVWLPEGALRFAQGRNVFSICLGQKLMPKSQVPYSPGLSEQFTIAYDVYVSLLDATRKEEVEDEEGNISRAGPSKERTDTRVPPGDYYLGREKVDKWTREVIANLLGDEVNLDDDGDNPCAERWKNMVNELTARMWGIFDETGIFLALCRHGFVLLVADMVRSGELAKYPLAMVEALLNALGKGLGGGYDIGCKFKSTLGRSPLGALSRAKGYQSLVVAFHGHAHNRLCQLKFLATYMVGLGIEDLEGCTFLCNNYYQSINILRTLPALRHWMKSNGIQSFSVFDTWIKEEYEFLSIRDKEPMVETLEMEYYQKLINFNAAEEILHKQWENSTPRDGTALNDLDHEGLRVAHQEADRRAALEHRDKNLEVVLHLERKLSIVRRWKAGDPEWERAAVLVGKRRYQRCIDELEKLVVSRLFELTNMNQSKSGYKMRKHMAVALESRSKAIKAALVRYNTAAAALPEPRPPLSWEEVVEYTFLADFDLLRDSNRVDPSQRPWALPAARLAMDNYFKICRAVEEIKPSTLKFDVSSLISAMRRPS
ncbi:hypothetical protein B0H10DRAFT_1960160 [Mycena sp. CBHHK59/15]|nr:hypothetical protein B0H10DRAFT_1960160 [Mycena sp. CBHHK59/15]